MNIENTFTNDSVCIFTDSSTLKLLDGTTTCCSGFCIASPYAILETGYSYMNKSTNNRGELYAIILGLQAALKYKKRIKIFSDSLYSIRSIRDSIFNQSKFGTAQVLETADKKDVLNQDLIMEIIYLILNYKISVQFFHQKGHVSIKSETSVHHALEVFCISNNIPHADINLIKIISSYNNIVDTMTKDMLGITINNYNSVSAIHFLYNGFDAGLYKNLIKGEK